MKQFLEVSMAENLRLELFLDRSFIKTKQTKILKKKKSVIQISVVSVQKNRNDIVEAKRKQKD